MTHATFLLASCPNFLATGLANEADREGGGGREGGGDLWQNSINYRNLDNRNLCKT